MSLAIWRKHNGQSLTSRIRESANSHTVVIADKLAQPQQLALTANQDTVYMSGVLDLREGPVVMELPAGLLGTLNNIWQQPLVDLGGPFSPEQNRGGRFLILPPGYDGPLPQMHHHVTQSDTNIVVFYLRAIPQTREDIPELIELIHTYRQYRLEDAADPPETQFVSLSGKDANLLTNEGFAYFETLARYINENPPRSQDMAMLGVLETLGAAMAISGQTQLFMLLKVMFAEWLLCIGQHTTNIGSSVFDFLFPE